MYEEFEQINTQWPQILFHLKILESFMKVFNIQSVDRDLRSLTKTVKVKTKNEYTLKLPSKTTRNHCIYSSLPSGMDFFPVITSTTKFFSGSKLQKRYYIAFGAVWFFVKLMCEFQDTFLKKRRLLIVLIKIKSSRWFQKNAVVAQ